MPSAPNEKVKQAEKLFYDGMTMVAIAKKLGISDGTVRNWKKRYGWKKASKKNECQQKRKRGGQPGNQNAKGGAGNPHPHPQPPPDRTTHGGYAPVFLDALEEDEQELLETVPEDTERQFMEQIQLFSIRERRILHAIIKCPEQMLRLEQELSTVQGKKTKAIEALCRYRMERARLESEQSGDTAADDWIFAILEEKTDGHG